MLIDIFNCLIQKINQKMIKKALVYLGRLLFILVFLTSIHSKFLYQDNVLSFYKKNYEYVQVSLRSFRIILPRMSEADEILSYFYYATMALQALITLFLVWGKSLAGYLLMFYYGGEATIEYLISRVGRGKSMDNIYFRWEFARFTALIGIALLFTCSHKKLKKPFQI